MNTYTIEEVRTVMAGTYRATNGKLIAVPTPEGDIELPAFWGDLNAGATVLEWLKTWQSLTAGLKCLADKVELDTGSAIAYGVPMEQALAGVVEDLRTELDADWDL